VKALALAAALFVVTPARAECACETNDAGDCIGVVTCAPETFNALAHAAQDAERDRDRCLAGNERLAAELVAAHRRIDALQAVVVPPVEPVSRLPWLAGGVVLGLALALGVAAAL
jgi:hypothetical protein